MHPKVSPLNGCERSNCLGLHTAFQMFKPRVENTAWSCGCEIDPALPPWILADRHRLVQILVNLLGNAIKITHQGGVILQISQQGKWLEFSVRDSGIGMTAQASLNVTAKPRCRHRASTAATGWD